MAKRILMTGGTGFIGLHLARALLAQGHEVTLATKNRGRIPESMRQRIKSFESIDQIGANEAFDWVVNLGGASIIERSWSVKTKQVILQSRFETTGALVQWIKRASKPPQVMISGSAIGFYGFLPPGQTCDETCQPGSDFLAKLCLDWEQAALEACLSSVRVCLIRTGIVLGNNGGALAKMLTPFKFGLGGPVGSGNQVMSWIHIKDMLALILFLLQNKGAEGPFNACSPNPVTNREFTAILGQSLKRPALLPLPGWLLKLAMGERADLLLKGQRIVPKRALEQGFTFSFPDLKPTLDDLWADLNRL